MTIDVLVYGWYNKGNIGDELMAHSLAKIFAAHDARLTLVDGLTLESLERCDGVIIGGGSILYGKPEITESAFKALLARKRPLFYVGIGSETEVHPDHRQLLEVSRSNIVRNAKPPAWMKNAYSLPDLVYALPTAPAVEAHPPKSLLVIPNVETIPTWGSPHWSHAAWDRFKDETAQFLDALVAEGTKPSFLLMCKNGVMDDAWAMNEIVARMQRRSPDFEHFRPSSDTVTLTDIIQGFEVVMTQRYHGIILAQMSGVPCISIDHHDKLRSAWPRQNGIGLQYHGITKSQLHDSWKASRQMPRDRIGSAAELYDQLSTVIIDVIDNERKARG